MTRWVRPRHSLANLLAHFWWGKTTNGIVSGATREYFHHGSATRAPGAAAARIRLDFSRCRFKLLNLRRWRTNQASLRTMWLASVICLCASIIIASTIFANDAVEGHQRDSGNRMTPFVVVRDMLTWRISKWPYAWDLYLLGEYDTFSYFDKVFICS